MMDGRFPRQDVINEILLFSSVKSLLRFRCVSKSWCSLIKSNDFIDNHLLRRQTNGNVMVVKRYVRTPERDMFSFYNINSPKLEELLPDLPNPYFKNIKFDYDYFYLPQRVNLMGPCNGLICLAYGDCVLLSNSALREIKRLPPTPFANPEGYCTDIIGYGFGNTCNDCYKVVLIESVGPEDHHINIYVYYSDTNSWRHIEDDSTPIKYICHFPCNELFFKGAFHWNANSTDIFYADFILTFDIITEVFKEMAYPHCLAQFSNSFLSLMSLNECLAMVRYKEWMEEPELFDIWVMKQYGVRESWTKQYVIGPQVVVCSHVCWKNDECLIVEDGNGQLVSCAFRTNEIKKLPIYAVEETLRVLIVDESLISLNRVLNF
uniref:SLF-like protein 1 n=1 Tax=Antirrhinum majus TaxID=4151 RepID=Q0GJI6_ANTMA|nr:SLF-like protein 1 [Antirrhinum majus]